MKKEYFVVLRSDTKDNKYGEYKGVIIAKNAVEAVKIAKMPAQESEKESEYKLYDIKRLT